MRLIGHLEKSSHAAAFGDFLFLEGIENDVEREDDGSYSVWAHDEDDCEKAAAFFEKFKADPDRPEFSNLEPKANQLRRRQQEEQEHPAEAAQYRDTDLRQAGARPEFQIGGLTRFLVAVSVFVFLGQTFELHGFFEKGLFITEFVSKKDGMIEWWPGLLEITQGHQYWRLVTPIFIHMGFFHIFFNMFLLIYLGSQVERAEGPWYLGVMTLVIAIPSNLAQYAAISPGFGGMSGVVYGIFGYIWFRSRINPDSDYEISNQMLMFGIVWFFICFIPGSNVANMVHAVGLLIGVIWGYLDSHRALSRPA